MREPMPKATVLPKTGMAVTIDLCDPKNIRSTNKQEVGRRLSLSALGTVYGKNVPATSGPLPVGSNDSRNSLLPRFRSSRARYRRGAR
jgi:sialate O-acetylesterase